MFKYIVICTSILVCAQVQAAFFIKSIECRDIKPTAEINIFFTTNDSATKVYPRRDNAIAYDYGNKLSPFKDQQSGQMSLVQNGGIAGLILTDVYDPQNPTTLTLTPNALNQQSYYGLLSGHIELKSGWTKVFNYPLDCVVIK